MKYMWVHIRHFYFIIWLQLVGSFNGITELYSRMDENNNETYLELKAPAFTANIR